MKVHGPKTEMRYQRKRIAFLLKNLNVKRADSSIEKSAFLMRPRLMEQSEHKSLAELILDIYDVKDLTPQIQEV